MGVSAAGVGEAGWRGMGGVSRVGASGAAHRLATAVGESQRLGEVDDLHERSAVDALRRRPRHR